MWIFTKDGFFSAVCARQEAGEHGQPIDPDRIMVRARVKGHLETLKDRFREHIGTSEIQEFERSDYAYRIFVPKATWSRILSELGDKTDSDNFKSAVACQGRAGRDYGEALHDVWSVMNRLQR